MQYVVIALLSFIAGCQVTTWKFEAKIAETAQLQADAENAATKRYDDHQAALQNEIGRLNRELEQKERAIEDDRRGVLSGSRVVYVAAKCPAANAQSGQNAGGTSGNSAGTARLEPAAGADYLDYKRRYQEQLNTLRKCVSFARAVDQARE